MARRGASTSNPTWVGESSKSSAACRTSKRYAQCSARFSGPMSRTSAQTHCTKRAFPAAVLLLNGALESGLIAPGVKPPAVGVLVGDTSERSAGVTAEEENGLANSFSSIKTGLLFPRLVQAPRKSFFRVKATVAPGKHAMHGSPIARATARSGQQRPQDARRNSSSGRRSPADVPTSIAKRNRLCHLWQHANFYEGESRCEVGS